MSNHQNTQFNNKKNKGDQTNTAAKKQKSEKDKNLNMQDPQ
ncbi:hypothetical protein [Brevibacillus fluminis]|nr:hypothetical protein [Brevibacillus fluminis]